MGDRFVERPIPGIEANLRHGGRADHKNHADNEECKTASSRGQPKGEEEFAALMMQVVYPIFNRLGSRQCLLPHKSRSPAKPRPSFADPASPRERAPSLSVAHTGCSISRDRLIGRSINPPLGRARSSRQVCCRGRSGGPGLRRQGARISRWTRQFSRESNAVHPSQ